jgi:hypothetical protein
LLQHCSEEKFGQDAIEWAIFYGHVKLTYDLETDVRTIMGFVPDGLPDETNYDRILAAYRRQCQEYGEALVELYRASGLMEEILRPVPLAQRPNLIEK